MLQKNTLIKTLSALAESFENDELAYLALTKKPEDVIRDKLAYRLHLALQSDPTVLVCREWRKRDLAIIRDNRPILLLEAKAVFGFDVVKSGRPHVYPKWLAEDVEKCWKEHDKSAGIEPDVLTLLIVVHPTNIPKHGQGGAIKYLNQLKRTKRIPSMDEIHNEVCNRVSVPCAYGSWSAGTAFGVDVEVGYWLFGPH